jgi:hypothetical protein
MMDGTMTGPEKPRSPRIVRRTPSGEGSRFSWAELLPSRLLETLRTYFGLGRAAPPEPIASPAALARFIDTRASFIAQTSLYGYLRTRAGMRYPELFDDDPFVEGINIAKWHIWLDCVGDLAVFTGSRLARRSPHDTPRIARMMAALLEDILTQAGQPGEAGSEFPAHADQVRDRVRRTDWLAIGDDEAAFSDSPPSVVRWAPVMDELKQLDEEIVLNSVRFRWQEVRRGFAQHLQPQALLAALDAYPPEPGNSSRPR